MTGRKRKFVVGDIVKLNSGGPTMTVYGINDAGTVWCQWFIGPGILHRDVFNEVILKASKGE